MLHNVMCTNKSLFTFSFELCALYVELLGAAAADTLDFLVPKLMCLLCLILQDIIELFSLDKAVIVQA